MPMLLVIRSGEEEILSPPERVNYDDVHLVSMPCTHVSLASRQFPCPAPRIILSFLDGHAADPIYKPRRDRRKIRQSITLRRAQLRSSWLAWFTEINQTALPQLYTHY